MSTNLNLTAYYTIPPNNNTIKIQKYNTKYNNVHYFMRLFINNGRYFNIFNLNITKI